MFRSRLSTPVRTIVAAASFVTSALFLALSASPAMAGAPAYRLAPVAAMAAADTVVVRDVLWNCNEMACVAKSSTSRPAIVCATAARKIGELASFTANGKEFTAEELADCNKKAK